MGWVVSNLNGRTRATDKTFGRDFSPEASSLVLKFGLPVSFLRRRALSARMRGA